MAEQQTEEDGNEALPSSAPSAYTPPAQFKPLEAPPLVEGIFSEDTELWLVRIQDSQLGQEDLKEKSITISINPSNDRLGSFESTKGTQFEILSLHQTKGVQPFAFLPRADTPSLDVCKISRQVAFVRSLNPPVLVNPSGESDLAITSSHNHEIKDDKPRTKPSNVEALGSVHDAATIIGTPSRVKGTDTQTVSTTTDRTVGGISTLESIQDDEERISMEHLTSKKSKKSKKDQASSNSIDLSPKKEVEDKAQVISVEKKRHKHKKMKMDTNTPCKQDELGD